MLNLTLNDQVNEEVVEDQRKLFVAKVVSNNDPEGLNRVKVTIEGKLEGEPNSLPWMAPLRLAPFGQGAGFGTFGTPPVGADLLVYLQDGDAEYGFYVAGYLGLQNKHATFSNPNIYGYQDPSGTIMVANMSEGTMSFTHASGYTYTIASDGSFTLDVPGNNSININGTDDQTIGGNRTLNVGGSLTNNVSGSRNDNISGSWNMSMGGGGGTFSSTGPVTISGTRVNINTD